MKRKNGLDEKPGSVAAIKPLLAKDADLGQIVEFLDKLDGEQPDNDVAEDEPDPKTEQILGMLRGKISDEDLAQIQAALSAPAAGAVKPQATDDDEDDDKPGAMDEPDQTAGAANADPKNGKDKEPIPMSKAAMDKAIKLACDATARDIEAKTIARLRGISEAEEVVKPYVGKLTAMDSAESVYKSALEVLKIDIKGVHPSAYKAVLMAQPKPGDAPKPRVAQDSSMPSDFLEAFPGADRIAR